MMHTLFGANREVNGAGTIRKRPSGPFDVQPLISPTQPIRGGREGAEGLSQKNEAIQSSRDAVIAAGPLRCVGSAGRMSAGVSCRSRLLERRKVKSPGSARTCMCVTEESETAMVQKNKNKVRSKAHASAKPTTGKKGAKPSSSAASKGARSNERSAAAKKKAAAASRAPSKKAAAATKTPAKVAAAKTSATKKAATKKRTTASAKQAAAAAPKTAQAKSAQNKAALKAALKKPAGTNKAATKPGAAKSGLAPTAARPIRVGASGQARAVPAALAKSAGQKISAPVGSAKVNSPKAIAAKAAAARHNLASQGPKKPVNQRHGFKTNEFIVYPAHGVGRIIGIEEQEIAGMALELFVINFDKEKLTLRVPTAKLTSVGMRKLADDGIVKKAMDTLKGRARIKRTMWSRRAQEYVAKINSGDLVSIAEVVRDLYRSEAQPEQSYSERQLYEDALDRMARELAAVEKLDERGAVQRITEVLSKSAKGRRAAEAEAEADVKAA